MEGTGYSLLLPDMNSAYMYENAAEIVPLEKLRRGDLIFMGEEDSGAVSHIALFDRAECSAIYFIDSTEKPGINGVTRRSYPAGDLRFKAFGIMKVKRR